MKAFLALFALASLCWAGDATACSCTDEGPRELATRLRSAQKSAAYIFVARAMSVVPPSGAEEGRPYSWAVATLEVKEALKGKLGKTVRMRSGSGGDCVSTFEPGADYLVYANGAGPFLESSSCSRTRRLQRSDDSERVFLRTGKLPPAPVALQRMSVRCEPCDISEVGKQRTGTEPIRSEELEPALRTGRPFFGAYYKQDGTFGMFAVGASAKGQAFELLQSSHDDSRQACLRQVTQRHCERLEGNEWDVRRFTVPGLRCINPGPWQPVCDEQPSRKVSAGGVEQLEAAKCHWDDPDRPTCELAKSSSPLGKGRAKWPRLVCYPKEDSSWEQQCLVRTKP